MSGCHSNFTFTRPRENMKRIGIKESHLALDFNFGERNSPPMIYKINSIFLQNYYRRKKKRFSFFFKIQNADGNSKGNKGRVFACGRIQPPLQPSVPQELAVVLF